MLASVALVGCTNTDEPEVNNGNETQKGDAYVTVKLAMSGNTGSRAFSDGGFEEVESTSNEVKVNKAIFYFLDANNQGCADKYTLGNVSNLAEWTESDGNNASTDLTSQAVVVIKNPIATPASIVCLINADDPFTDNNRPSLAQIQAAVVDMSKANHTANGFMMTNSVYVDGTNVIVGAPIKAENIHKSDADATVGNKDIDTSAPVVIPVERVVAKVKMQFDSSITNSTIKPTLSNNTNEYNITAEITGWWLASKANCSYLVKSLSASYADFTDNWWNDKNNTRSYWANMPSNVEYTNSTTWAGANVTSAAEYCLENTSTVIDKTDQDGTGTATQYAARAILKKDGEAITFVRYLNTIYTQPDFFQLIADAYNSYRIKVEEGETVVTYDLNGQPMIQGKTAIATVLGWNYNGKNENENLGLENYEGMVTVTAPTTAGQSLVKVTTDAQGNETYADVDAATIQNEIRTRIDKVLLWLNGQTYYYTDIIHNNDGEAPLYGVVRNHLYTLNVKGLTGMGTPVPNPKLPINPERPENDEYSHISAQVQILSYKVVPTQDVTLR